ncbi:hypothetical protein [Mycoplasma sp. 'Moose RK']|uniref:hypothetical protein n=1 Tax=Mycoplasma sp. 'Moose RK' TaxID=2780095 RepID=UPI0018C24A9C|nr:hypothetical protein [Mycoplasma sp. 'Moose RK']MBG0730633.1 hypothetical protein [Mycoplasma sp. 'Moose RK']
MFKKKQKTPKPKYKFASEVVYGNVVLQKLKEIKQVKRFTFFFLLVTIIVGLALGLVFLVLYFAGNGQNIQEIISRN